MTKLYADRDTNALEPHYYKHVNAMTTERLHAKSHIAAELAWRDKEIARLRKALSEVRNIASDRERFVMLGPRGFIAAVHVVDDALGEQE